MTKPKTVTAILIDPFACTVETVQLTRDLESYYAALSHESMPVRTFELTYRAGLTGADALFFDEDGLYKGAQRAFVLKGYDTPLLGKALIVGANGRGGSADAETDIKSIRDRVMFLEVIGTNYQSAENYRRAVTPWMPPVTTYRLGSAEMVNAPGMVKWAINGATFASDREYLINVIATGWKLPEDAARKLIMGEVPYTVEGETVVFSVPK